MTIDRLLLSIALPTLLGVIPASAQEPSQFPEETWISSVAWLNDSQLVGSRSQGLLLRSGEVVQVSIDELDAPEVLGTAETSIWRVVPIENQILAADYKGGVHVFGNEDPRHFDTKAKWIRALTLAPGNPTSDETQVLAGTEDGELVVLSLDEMKEIRRVDAHDAQIFDIAVHPKGTQVATAGGDGRIHVFSWPELMPIGEMSRGEQAIWSLIYSEDGKQIISGGAANRIQAWDTDSFESVCTIAKSREWITDLISLPGTSLAVASCMDGQLVVVDYGTLQLVDRVPVADSSIWSIALSPAADQIAIGTRKNGFAVAGVGSWQQKSVAIADKLEKLRPPKPKHP